MDDFKIPENVKGLLIVLAFLSMSGCALFSVVFAILHNLQLSTYLIPYAIFILILAKRF